MDVMKKANKNFVLCHDYVFLKSVCVCVCDTTIGTTLLV